MKNNDIPNYIVRANTSHKALPAQNLGYLNGIGYLLPGREICHNYKNCISTCFFNSGRLGLNQTALFRRSNLYRTNKKLFSQILERDIINLIIEAERYNLKAAFRLNGTSDIDMQQFGLIEKYPEVQFYDYTKDYYRRSKHKNYYLTYSYDGTDEGLKECAHILNCEIGNIAVIDTDFDDFSSRMLVQRSIDVTSCHLVDGDAHDLRFLDQGNSIVRLKAKGKLK